jgi:gas vesicle protein
MSRHELDELFDEATSTPSQVAPPATPALRHIEARSPALDALLNRQLTALLDELLAYERKKAQVRRVDGLIIGTGEADFTKGNTLYPLNYKGKRFQLIDVPGIEGDESKYAHMVREAVAKAHLVFYVNGTNKKPEKATAQKIRTYLRLGTQVCTLINIRGNADAYEFEEDRESLAGHGGSTAALQQTEEVLRSVLGSKVMHPGHCVQGLLAFSALASDAQTGRTTIDPSRGRDLVIQQRNYQKHFASPKAMYEFSQIKSVAKVLHGKLATFREDMIESNKTKVHELLVENAATLQALYASHEAFVSRTKPEFEKCREAIKGALERFERLVIAGRKNLWDKLFNSIKDDADEIVEQYFGDNDTISSKINRAFKNRQESLKDDLQGQFEMYLTDLRQDLQQAIQRLLEDVSRVELEQLLCDADTLNINYKTPELGLGLELSDYGWMAFNIGSYALAGAGIGTAFPVIGNLIGAIAGALVGILVSLLSFFTSKEKRIRKAQGQVQEKIDDAWSEARKALQEERKTLFAPVRKQIDEAVLARVQQLDDSLKRPLKIIEQQMALMNRTKEQLENMPYGTIQAVQR